MKEIKVNGQTQVNAEDNYRAATSFVGTNDERLAMTTMVPGDTFVVVDETVEGSEVVVAGYLYSGSNWCIA